MFPQALVKAAQSCVVRECDKEKDGRYVAYVDEGDDSYDVSLKLNKKGKIIESACECDAAQPCRHAVALALFVADDHAKLATPDVPKKAKKIKQDPLEILLEETDETALKSWLRLMMQQDKELALAFKLHFENAGKLIAPAEAAEMTRQVVMTVMGRKRSLDTAMVQRIVDLWRSVHAPIIARYAAGPADEAAFLPLQAMLDVCSTVYQGYNNTDKVRYYFQEVLSGYLPQFATLAVDAAFETATGFFIANLPLPSGEIRLHYLLFLDELSKICQPERVNSLALRLGTQFRQLYQKCNRYSREVYAQKVLDIVLRAGVFSEFSTAFPTIPNADKYNEMLIRALIDAGHYAEAETAAWSQMSDAKDGGNNAAYLLLLKDIYKQTSNEAGRLRVARELLPFTYDLEDFLEVQAATEDETQRKNFRQAILTKSRRRSFPEAVVFAFRLAAHEGRWKQALSEISLRNFPLPVLVPFFDDLFDFDKDTFLKGLLRIERSYYRSYDAEEDAVRYQLAGRILEAYGEDEVRAAIARHEKDGYHGWYNGPVKQALVKLLQRSER